MANEQYKHSSQSLSNNWSPERRELPVVDRVINPFKAEIKTAIEVARLLWWHNPNDYRGKYLN